MPNEIFWFVIGIIIGIMPYDSYTNDKPKKETVPPVVGKGLIPRYTIKGRSTLARR